MEQERSKAWLMRLTLVNTKTEQTAFAMYPEDQYSILESLDRCEIPYGSGAYRHLAESPNGVYSGSLQAALAGVIESETHPPSIQELNYLSRQIQRMTAGQRAELGRQAAGAPEATVTDAINAAHRLLCEELVYDGRSMADRAVLLGEDEPYIRVQLLPDNDGPEETPERGVWVDCPARESDLAAAVKELGATSIHDLTVGEWDGLLAVSDVPLNENNSPFVVFEDIDQLARTMKEKGVLQELGKYKALLQVECCVDFDEAAELAGKLGQYEFCRQAEFQNQYRIAGLEMDQEEAVRELDFEETDYGLIRPVREQTVGQELKALRWRELENSPNPLLALVSQLYGQTDGLCEAGPGPGGIGVSTGGGSKIHLLLSFDPPPVLDNVVFPKEIEGYEMKVTGYWHNIHKPIQQEELRTLRQDPDPSTQTVAKMLWELGQETRAVSTEECYEAFDVLTSWEMRKAFGPTGNAHAAQEAAGDQERGPTMCQL